MSPWRPLLVLAGIGATVFAVHCSSSDSGSSAPSCTANDPTTIRHLTADQKTLVTQAGDRTKAALSAAEWRYLFKLRYAMFPRDAVETDPVVVKALATITQGTAACGGVTTTADTCERFSHAEKCWNDSPVSSATVPCFMWSMIVATSFGCTAPTAGAADHVDPQAWDDSQDGIETTDCEAPCIAGGGCSHGACKCPADEAPCPGGCGRLKTDEKNCGRCEVACGAGVSCVEGACGGSADAGTDGGI